MKWPWQFRLLLVLAAMALVPAAAWVGRPRVQAWTRARLARRLVNQIAARPEAAAALVVQALEQDEPEWLEVYVAAFADERLAVATAGQAALVDALERWESAAPAHAAPRVSALAGLLANHASRLPPERLAVAQGLAHKLLAWPIDGRLVNAAGLIANCEAILNLPPAELAENELAPTPAITPFAADADRASSGEPQLLARPPAIRISDR